MAGSLLRVLQARSYLILTTQRATALIPMLRLMSLAQRGWLTCIRARGQLWPNLRDSPSSRCSYQPAQPPGKDTSQHGCLYPACGHGEVQTLKMCKRPSGEKLTSPLSLVSHLRDQHRIWALVCVPRIFYPRGRAGGEFGVGVLGWTIKQPYLSSVALVVCSRLRVFFLLPDKSMHKLQDSAHK